MTLSVGTNLGRYEIRSKIGEGGMGEVYRAFDPKINREVAIKVLPAAFSDDKDRLARFEQEAQAAGALNHPNILSIYDVDTHQGSPYVVSELLEGETLHDRMKGVALPSRKALDYALQVAKGLATAHERGIVHRDLKPDNIFITKDGRVKILDFGLAKLTESSTDSEGQTDVPTRKVKTDPGAVMGTVGYMSPEQVRGRTVDHRSDIFSFGAVLYEMLSGKRAFRGESAVDTLSAILKEDPPDLSTTNSNVAPELERVVRHCLEKNPAERFQSARDLGFALESLSSSSRVSDQTMSAIAALPMRTSIGKHLPWIVASALAIALIVMILIGVFYSRRPTPEANAVRFSVAIPEGAVFYSSNETHNMNVSPDGRQLAFVAFSQGQRVVWVRPLGELTAQAIPGTEGASSIFWSPDSHYLAFFADAKLKRVEVSGKSLQTVCSLPVVGEGSGAWSKGGTIIFSPNFEDGKIYSVPAAGGTPSRLVDNESGWARRWFRFLPDGRRFLVSRHNEKDNNEGIYAGSLDSSELREVAAMPFARSQYVNGYLLYPREGSLVAQAFDEKDLRLTGEPTVVVERLPFFDKTGWAEFSASENGVLAYMTELPKTRLVWVDRSGRETGQVGAPDDYGEVRLSSDGQKAALRINDPRTYSGDIWIQDLARDTRTRFVSGPADDGGPVWSPDDRQLVYFSCCEDPSSLHIKGSGDTGKGQTPLKEAEFLIPDDWSQDGRFIIYEKNLHSDLWVLRLSGDVKPYPLMQTEPSESKARFSPDGRWIAFVSDETGRPEVYVTSFDHPGEKWRISIDGGSAPRWRRDGKELFYLAADSKVMAVQIKPGEKFDAGTPTALFKADPLSPDYDVSADGQRFLFIASAPGTQLLPFAIILDWTADLKQKQ